MGKKHNREKEIYMLDFNNVQYRYKDGVTAISKGNDRYFCVTCKKTMDQKQFFKTTRLDRHPSGVLPECKICITRLVDDADPTTFLSILKEADAPYSAIEWRKLLMKKTPGSPSVLGKYLSKMKLNQFKRKHWTDSELIAKEESSSVLEALRQQAKSETEAQEKLDEMMNLQDVQEVGGTTVRQSQASSITNDIYGLTPETSKYNLTQEEIDKLKLDWGEDYTEEQFFRLEQMFADMKASYVLQDPISIQNVRFICKMTIKVNKLLDIEDIESATKLSRQLDLFIKSTNLAPVQQKDRQQATFAISQLAFLVEREGGFIPEFYIDKPKDKIDQILFDMKEYTNFLVKGESGLDDMIANTEAILAKDKLPDIVESEEDFEALENELLNDIDEIEINQEEFQ